MASELVKLAQRVKDLEYDNKILRGRNNVAHEIIRTLEAEIATLENRLQVTGDRLQTENMTQDAGRTTHDTLGWYELAGEIDDIQVMLHIAWRALEKKDYKQAIIRFTQAWAAFAQLKVKVIPVPKTHGEY